MRKLFAIGLLLFSATLVMAQNTSTADAKDLKTKKIIIAFKEYPKKANTEEKALVDSTNAALKFAMEKYWKFSTIDKVMSLTEAKSFVKNNKANYCYITIDLGVTESMTHHNAGNSGPGYKYVSSSEKLSIYTPKLIASVFLPRYEGPMSHATAVYAVMQLQKILEVLMNGEIKSILGSGDYVKKNGPKTTKKTLLIPKEYFSPKISVADIKTAYPYSLEICDLNKVEKAILDKDPKYAVIYYVPIPLGGKMLHRLYISNAEDGEIYGVADGSKVEVNVGMFSFGGQNKDYLINKKELKQIGDVVKVKK